jgi:hypothetical protein
VIADWAARQGVEPPSDVGAAPQAVADWLVRSGPGVFGAPDWTPDRSVARLLLLAGVLAPDPAEAAAHVA